MAQKLTERNVEVAIYSPLSELRTGADPVSWLTGADSEDVRLGFPKLSGEAVPIDARNAVWWLRNKVRLPGVFDEHDQRRHFELDTREAFVRSCITATGATALNGHPLAPSLSKKIIQLSTASALGFSIPRTLVSSSKRDVLSFLESNPNAIIKPLHASDIPAISTRGQKDISTLISIMTNELTLMEAQEASEDEFLSAPMIIQERIEKDYELRVVAFAEDALAYRVRSQSVPGATLDWRRAEGAPDIIDRNRIELDDSARTFVKQFLQRSHLDCGVFDFAVEKTGRTVFFECNPAGQWGALEPDNGDPIASMFAKHIAVMCAG
ncbi:MAG: hypothetical protein NXI12_09635 [Alphaproteobacteria bacterium]|nr:hypothetical protein [Alphaproteobacteria bacterium]